MQELLYKVKDKDQIYQSHSFCSKKKKIYVSMISNVLFFIRYAAQEDIRSLGENLIHSWISRGNSGDNVNKRTLLTVVHKLR